MKKLYFLIILIVAVLLAAPTKHLFKYNANGIEFDTTTLDWQEATKVLRIQAYDAGSFYCQTFSAGELKDRSGSSEDWHGVITFTAWMDTVVGDTTTIDSVYITGQPDTLYFILEKNTGTHWATIDTLEWYLETAPGVSLGETLISGTNRGQYLFYMTDASRDTSETARYLETFVHDKHRIHCFYGDTTYIDFKMYADFY